MEKFNPEALLKHTLGVRSAVDFAIPTGVDGSEVFKFSLRSNRSPEEIVRMAAAALGAANQEIVNRYGSLFTITESLYGFTRQGEATRSMTPKSVEFAQADAIHSSNLGSMLPLTDYKDALGWTPEYLRDAMDMQLNADVAFLVERWLNRFDYQLLLRALTNTENAIGSVGYDVPWAIGTGTNVDYIPPQFMGKVFDSTHTHFIVENSSGGKTFADLFNDMVATLREHGYTGRPVVLVSEDDLTTITALTNFVQLLPPGIQTLGSTASLSYAAVGEYEGIPGSLVGYFKSTRGMVEIRFHTRIPTGYAWMTVPLGAGNAQNPLAIRVHPDVPFGMNTDVKITDSIVPRLKQIDALATFGIGVNSRLGACAGYIAGGAVTWVNPTFTGATEL